MKIEDSKKAKLIADQAAALSSYAEQALVVAKQLRLQGTSIGPFPLQDAERMALGSIRSLSPGIKKKLTKKNADFTVSEVVRIMTAVGELLPDAEPMRQLVLLLIVKRLMDCLKERILPAGREKSLR